MRFAQAVQAIRHQFVHLRFKQRLQRSLEVSTGQYPPVKRPSETLSERELACEQALLFGRAKRTARERASERRSRKGPAKGELATIPFKFSFVLRPDKGKYHWLKNDVPEIKVD